MVLYIAENVQGRRPFTMADVESRGAYGARRSAGPPVPPPQYYPPQHSEKSEHQQQRRYADAPQRAPACRRPCCAVSSSPDCPPLRCNRKRERWCTWLPIFFFILQIALLVAILVWRWWPLEVDCSATVPPTCTGPEQIYYYALEGQQVLPECISLPPGSPVIVTNGPFFWQSKWMCFGQDITDPKKADGTDAATLPPATVSVSDFEEVCYELGGTDVAFNLGVMYCVNNTETLFGGPEDYCYRVLREALCSALVAP